MQIIWLCIEAGGSKVSAGFREEREGRKTMTHVCVNMEGQTYLYRLGTGD